MTAKIDYSGTRQGMLYISHQTKRPPDQPKKEVWWHCACDCGEIVPLASDQIRGGRTDCGCVVPIRRRKTSFKANHKPSLLLHPVLEQFLYSRPQVAE